MNKKTTALLQERNDLNLDTVVRVTSEGDGASVTGCFMGLGDCMGRNRDKEFQFQNLKTGDFCTMELRLAEPVWDDPFCSPGGPRPVAA